MTVKTHREKILVVDDETNILDSLEGVLTDEGYEVDKAPDGETALKRIEEKRPDLILLDIWLPRVDGIELLRRVKNMNIGSEVVMMSGHGSIDTAVEATKLGAFDFIEKPISMEDVLITVNRALTAKRISKSESADLADPLGGFIGVDKPAETLKNQLRTAAASADPVILIGETGTGKKYSAKLIHSLSDRKLKPFVIVDCAKLKPANFALELYGAGGKLDQAADGTIYFDSIDQLGKKLQDKLVRLLSTREYRTKLPDENADSGLDETAPKKRFTARVISSSTADTSVLAEQERFRAKLAELVADRKIPVVPLRQRREDIPRFTEHYLAHFGHEYGKQIDGIDDDAMTMLTNMDWPGNIRELRNMIERIVMSVSSGRVRQADIPLAGAGLEQQQLPGFEGYSSLEEAERAWERQFIVHHLKKNRWNIANTAAALRLSPEILLKKIRTQNIHVMSGKNGGGVPQRTLKRSVVVCGQGLHSGIKTGMILSPMPPNTGIVFGDISTGRTITAVLDNVVSTNYATTLQKNQMAVKTIEHIMAVLHMYGIHNLLIKIGDEVPIMDGSAQDFCSLIEDGGILEQDEYVEPIKITGRIEVVNEKGSNKASISIEPSDRFEVNYLLDYPQPVGRQEYNFVNAGEESFRREIAPARTFGFVRDVRRFEEKGLASGGKLSNLILIDDEKIINAPLRFPEELARHKILDITGDLYLLGRPVLGKITAKMSGHTENMALLKRIQDQLAEYDTPHQPAGSAQ